MRLLQMKNKIHSLMREKIFKLGTFKSLDHYGLVDNNNFIFIYYFRTKSKRLILRFLNLYNIKI